MADINQLYDALRKADAAGNAEDAKALSAAIKAQGAAPPSPREALAYEAQHPLDSFMASKPGGLIKGATEIMGNAEEGIPRALGYIASYGGNVDGPISRFLNMIADKSKSVNEGANAAYDSARIKTGHTGFDAPRLLGNIASPVNIAGGEALGLLPEATSVFGNIFRGGATGATLGALEAPDGSRAAGAGFGGAGGAAVPALLSGGSRLIAPIVDKISEFTNPATQKTRAVNEILRHVTSDEEAGGPSLMQLRDRLVAASRNGQPLALADIAGDSVKGLAEGMMNEPGQARQIGSSYLLARDKAAQQGSLDDLTKYLSPETSKFDTLQSLAANRAAQSRGPYERAMSATQVWSPRIQQFLDDPVLKSGLSKGVQLQRLDALANGEPFDPHSYGITDFNSAGDPIITGTPNMRTLDLGKRGLDAIVNENKNDITGRLTDYGRAVDNVRKAYLGELDNLNPDYAAARKSYAAPSRQMEAVQNGAKFHTKDPEVISHDLENLSLPEQEMYRIGAANTLRNKLLSTRDGANEANRVGGSEMDRQRLVSLFGGEDNAKPFLDAIANRNAAFQTKADMLGNSRTALRLAAQNTNSAGGAGMNALEVGAGLLTHNPLLTASGAARSVRPTLNFFRGPNNATKAEMAHALFSDQGFTTPAIRELLNPGTLPGSALIKKADAVSGPGAALPLVSLLNAFGI